MKLIVNGETAEVSASTLRELLNEYKIESKDDEKGVAVAVNDAVVPRDRWSDQHLNQDDRIEIIRATQGG